MPTLAFAVLLEFIASRLRELRRQHNLTQEQMASLLGTDVKWYQRIEWKEKDIRASTIDRLAAVFGVSTVAFLAEKLPDTAVKAPQKAPHRPKKKPGGTKPAQP
jgi:transcriptional regulator with XRE-family HTH domain